MVDLDFRTPSIIIFLRLHLLLYLLRFRRVVQINIREGLQRDFEKHQLHDDICGMRHENECG